MILTEHFNHATFLNNTWVLRADKIPLIWKILS
jgi:hypothetical protein